MKATTMTTTTPRSGPPRVAELPAATDRPPTHEELLGYCEWLFMEHRLLCLELWPDENWREAYEATQAADPRLKPADRYSPCGTIGGDFHFPDDGRTWQDVPKPSTRCLAVFRAIGIPTT